MSDGSDHSHLTGDRHLPSTSTSTSAPSPSTSNAAVLQPSPSRAERDLFAHAIQLLLIKALSIIGVLAFLAPICLFTPYVNTYFALFIARPLYQVYPRVVAAMILGGVGGTICSIPVKLSVLAFHWLFHADIRSPRKPYISSHSRMAWSVIHDAADAARLGIVLGPVLVMLVDRKSEIRAREPLDALDAAAGGQLAAALLDSRILFAWVHQLWQWTLSVKEASRPGGPP